MHKESPPVFRDIVRAGWFAIKWGLLAAVVAAVGLGLYYYSRLNDEIRQRVQAKFASQYPHLQVAVRSAQLIDGQGIEVRGLSISDPRLSGPPAELAYFDEVLLSCQTSLPELLKHEPKISRITVRRPRLQAVRLSDGSWSLAQLLPLPKFGDSTADILVENAQVIVFDPQRNPPATYSFRDINLGIKPVVGDSTADQGTYEVLGSLVADHVQRIEIAGRVNRATGGADLTGTVAGIDVSPELIAALPPEQSAHLQPLAPLRGQASLSFHVQRRPEQAQSWQFDVLGELTSARFDDARLPQALADLRATFHADNNGFQVNDLTSRNGPTTLRFSARVDGYQSGAPMAIEGEAMHLLVGRQWEPIIPPKLLEQWRKFLPDGEVNVKGARAVFDGSRWRLEGTVECLKVSFWYYRFPYRLASGAGTLRLTYDEQLRQNRLSIDLSAFAGSRPVKIDGEFLNPGPEFTGGVTLHGEELPFDQNLYSAIAEVQPRSSEVIQSLHLGGTFNFWLNARRDDPHSPLMKQDLNVNLNHCSLRYDKFPYPLYSVVGNLKMVDGQWTFRELTGTNHAGLVSCEGSLTPVPGGVSLSLEFQGRNVVLEEELRDALPPRMQQLWNDLKPKGSFDLVKADVNYTSADKRLEVTTVVRPVGDTMSIHPTFFPYRLEKLQGTVTFRDGRADFDAFHGVHDRTPVSASGYCEHGPDGNWHLHCENLTADHLRPDTDRDLIIALPAKLRKTVVQLNPTGLLSLHGTVDFWGQRPPLLPNGSPPAVPGECNVVAQWQNLQLDMEQGTLHAGIDLQNIHGGVVLSGRYDAQRPEGERLLTRGELNIDSVTWNNFQFTNLSGPLWMDDRQVRFGSLAEPAEAGPSRRRIGAKCYGGVASADGWVALDDTPRFSLQAALDNLDLNRFCTEAVPGRQKLKGRVAAGFELSGTAAGLHTLKGQGELKLREADIYRLPVMVALLKFLNLKPADTSAFSTSDFKFRIDGEHVLLDNIEFSGDAISLVGEGEMNLATDINLRLQPIMGRSDIQLPAWKRLMGATSEQFMQIQVTGTLADPRVKREPFPTINQALQSFQTGMQPQDRKPLPQGLRPTPGIEEAPRR